MNLSPKHISQLGRVVTGKTPSTTRSEFFGGEYLFVTPSDLQYNHYYVRTTERTVTDEAKTALPNQFIPAGAVMFTCIGATIGKCGIASAECLTNQQINSIIANDYTDSKFVYYLLCHNQDLVKGLGGGAATPIVSKAKFEQVELLVPSLPHQRAIAHILSAYDDLIENNRRRMTLLEDAARQLYREWFVRLRFPGHEHTSVVDGIPEGWKKTSVQDLAHIMSGGTPKTTVTDFWDGDIPFYTPKDAVEECYVLDTEKHLTERGLNSCNSKLYAKDTIFLTARGTVGKLNLAQRPMAMNQSCYALKARDGVSQLFLFLTLNQAIRHFQQHAVGAVFEAIIVDTFKLIPFTVPQVRLTRNFDDTVSPMFKEIENLILQNQRLTAARDILLPRLIGGELAL
jgi:type I restriction enzyme S subunit